MMGYYGSMMGGWGSMSFFGFVTWLEVVIIGALVIVWLWKKITK